jgi:hypothetical protein
MLYDAEDDPPRAFGTSIKTQSGEREMNCRAALFAVSALIAFSSAALAASRDDTLEEVSKCATIVDDKLRLGCYDSLAPHVREALGTPPDKLAGNPTADEQKSWFGFDIAGLFGGNEEKPQNAPQQFGQESVTDSTSAPTAPEMQEIDSITAGVTDYSFRDNKFTVFLDNGQIWQQLSGDFNVARFRNNPKDNSITISRGFLKSYNLKINDDNSFYKVKRLK